MLESWLESFIEGEYLKLLYYTALLMVAIATAGHAILNKHNPRASLGWVVFILASPIAGSLSYTLFGRNRVQRKGLGLSTFYSKGRRDYVAHLNPKNYQKLKPVVQAGDRLFFSPLCPISAIAPLNTGDEAYPEMLAAIAGAKRSITLYSYIFHHDRAGETFLDALIAARNRGVEIKVHVDGVGSSGSIGSIKEQCEAAGIGFAVFLPVIWRPQFANLRNHRKLLIVDGEVAFTGGLNIGAIYWPKLVDDGQQVLDFHFKLKGTIVRYLQAAFADDWKFSTDEVLRGEPWFAPKPSQDSDTMGRVVISGPGENSAKMQWHFIGAINAAKHKIALCTPYFIPSAEVEAALQAAALRGVTVQIVVPAKTDMSLVTLAMNAGYQELLRFNCQVYVQEGLFDHSKLLVIDDRYLSIGSANWDVRSLRLNFEMNVEVFSKELAHSIHQVLAKKISGAKALSYDGYMNRPLTTKVLGGMARMLAPLL